MNSFPTRVKNRIIKRFDNLKRFFTRFSFGKTDNASVDTVTKDSCDFIDLFSTFLAEHFNLWFINELCQLIVTTIFSGEIGSSSTGLAGGAGTTS